MSATHNKKTESKYVSCFADSRPDVDITFRDVLLRRPTDHYLVGVDNFSLTNSSLSMIEPVPEGTVYHDLISIRINPAAVDGNATPGNSSNLDERFANGADGVYSGHLLDPDRPTPFSLRIASTETILSVQQLMRRLGDLAADVNEFMRQGLAHPDGHLDTETGGYTPAADENVEHLSFELLPQGHIWISGTKAFWSCFSVQIPSVRNQQGFYGPPLPNEDIPFTGLRQFLSVNPYSGNVLYDKILTNRYPKAIPTEAEGGLTLAETQTAAKMFNKRCIGGGDPHYLAMAFANPGNASNDFNNGANASSRLVHTVRLRGSVFSSLERRIAIEIGCSLPVTNSPMVDHGKEAPDFVLGRWIWRTDQRVSANASGGQRQYEGPSPTCVQYQGPQDRILYHELMAQSKIQTLRVRLFARLRTFNELTEEWGMRVIELPAVPSDWWHARLHFISRD